jgi:hypothetical protein
MAFPVDKNVTFRSLMSGEVTDLLRDEGLVSAAASSSIVAVASRLASLREEGQPLSPEVYFCADVETLVAVLPGSEVIELGRGPQEDRTVLRALKECAPLATGGWAIFVDWKDGQFRYGVMTPINLPLSITPYEALVENAAGDTVSIVVRKIAESCVELHGAKGNRRCLYFSDRRAEIAGPAEALAKFCVAATRSVPADQRDDVRRFFYRTLTRHLVHANGAIFVVQSARRKLSKKLRDCTLLPSPLSITSRVIDYRQHKDNEALAKLESASSLIQGMLSSDGIVVFTNAGTIIAYRAFLKLPPNFVNPVAGGARRRTFEALKALIGREIKAAFIASHDGQTEFTGDDNE